jgi:hypothetical protein
LRNSQAKSRIGFILECVAHQNHFVKKRLAQSSPLFVGKVFRIFQPDVSGSLGRIA